jgi:hypothetical protein
MSTLFHRHAFSMLDDSYRTVGVQFLGEDGDINAPSIRSKTYVYKAPKTWELVAGDFALVMVNTALKIVRICEIHAEPQIDLEAQYPYKWLVQKIDMSEYDALMTREQEFDAFAKDHARQVQRRLFVESVPELARFFQPKEIS